MSLRGFHLIFLVLAILCCGGFWMWSRVFYENAVELNALWLAQSSGLLAILLTVYTLWFIFFKRKLLRN